MALFSTNHTLTQGSSLCSPTLGYQKQNPDGVRLLHKSCKHPLPAPPSPWRGVGGEALMLRLYSKLVFFLWFSLLIHIFHQT